MLGKFLEWRKQLAEIYPEKYLIKLIKAYKIKGLFKGTKQDLAAEIEKLYKKGLDLELPEVVYDYAYYYKAKTCTYECRNIIF